ncbi:MAG: alpha/beta fold hydrolase, partial [Crocinitomicaceae bacterium]|nr:alpha/beta fold hydrolase [Crocinitomicaceae bacterium]
MSYLLYIFILIAAIYAGLCVVYFIIQERFIFVPTFLSEPFHSKLATPADEIFIDTPNSGRIHALLLNTPESKGLIFYLHGNTGSLTRWQFMAEEVAGYGYDVFAMDYRGYGRSRGPRREAYMHRDVEFCYDWILKQRNYNNVVIYGRSLGSGFATRLAARRRPSRLVLETPFFSLLDVARYYLPFLPTHFLLRYRMRSDLQIKLVDCPTHIFHGTRDIVVPYSSAL